MAEIKGTVAITGQLSPIDTLDTYPVATSEHIRGGIHSVADVNARNAIPGERLEVGMLCYVQSEKVYYQYVADTGAGDPGWKEYSGGGSGGSGIKPVESEEEMEALSAEATPGMLVYRTDESIYYRWTNVAEEGEPASYDWVIFDNFVDINEVRYTTTEPTTANVGGIPAGSEFTDEPLINIVDQLLHPYLEPKFTTFTVTPSKIEVGGSVSEVTFSWAISNPNNVEFNSINLVINGETITLDEDERIPVNTITRSITPITSTTVAKKTSTMSVNDVKGSQVSATADISFLYGVYHGVSNNAVLTSEEIVALTKELKEDVTGKYTFSAGGYEYIAFPSSWTDPNMIKDTGGFIFAYDMLDPVTVTTETGQEIEYKVIRSTNLLHTPEPMIVS